MSAYVTSDDAPFVFGAYAAHVDRAATNVLADPVPQPGCTPADQAEEPEGRSPSGVEPLQATA